MGKDNLLALISGPTVEELKTESDISHCYFN